MAGPSTPSSFAPATSSSSAPASTSKSSATAAYEWTWDAAQGVYFQPASGMYALAAADGWTYLTPEELAGSHARAEGDAAAARERERDSPAGAGLEEGEVEDDVGWGGLMDPDKLARVVEGQRQRGDEVEREREWDTEREKDRDRERDREQRHPAYSNGYGWDEGDDTPSRATPDPSALVRLVVRRSKALERGAVAVIDAREGGVQLGRDRCEVGGTARVRVREMEVSKTHALVYWGRGGNEDEEEEAGWWIVDLGSTLGTYVAHRGERDAHRLSDAKCASRPYPLRHLSVVTVGTTTFVAHVHADWPCGECQLAGNTQIPLDDGGTGPGNETAESSPAPPGPGSGRLALDAGQRRGERQLKRKLELSALKDTLLGKEQRAPSAHAHYLDRSAQRRRLHGSSPPRNARSTPPATVSAGVIAAEPTGPSLASRAMLAKHGWSEGQGLGRQRDGRAEPIVATQRSERAGLGARGEKKDVEVQGDGGWKARGMRRRWDEVAS